MFVVLCVVFVCMRTCMRACMHACFISSLCDSDYDTVIHFQVSILLRDKAQLSDGHFVMPVGGPVSWGADVPGTIRYQLFVVGIIK